MRALLLVAALIEAATGLALLLAPSRVVSLLIGTTIDAPSGLVVARVAGSALLSLALICWLARNDAGSTLRNLGRAFLLYNVFVAAILVHAHVALGLSGIALWPAVIIHAALAIGCVVGMSRAPTGLAR